MVNSAGKMLCVTKGQCDVVRVVLPKLNNARHLWFVVIGDSSIGSCVLMSMRIGLMNLYVT